jgi:hypothetical protein
MQKNIVYLFFYDKLSSFSRNIHPVIANLAPLPLEAVSQIVMPAKATIFGAEFFNEIATGFLLSRE